MYRTNDPNLIISAVQYFPKMNNSVEKISQFIGTEKFAKDLKLTEIVATYENYYGGHDFVPIHFANTCPKLEKLQKYIKTKNMFVCIGYISLVYPSHVKFKEYVEYYPFDIDSNIWKWLFKQCILSYIHEQTSNWDIETKEHLFNLVGIRRFFNATFTYTVKLIEMKNLNELSNHMLLEHFTDAVADKNYNPSSEDYNQSGFTYDELKNEILTRMSKTKQDE